MKAGQKASFSITLTQAVCKELGYTSNEATATVEVKESGAFAYGNQTATVMTITNPDGKSIRKVYDTRYVTEEFDHFAWNLVYDWFRDGAIDEMDRTDVERKFILRLFNNGKQVKQKTIKAMSWNEAEAKSYELQDEYRRQFIQFEATSLSAVLK